jgi:site-specific DNA-methyltransferase (adenine-specific)
LYNPKATYKIHHGDMLKVLPTLEGKFHAVFCDPPYGLEFMGKAWDSPGAVLKTAAEAGGFQDGNGGNPYSRSRVRIGCNDATDANNFEALVKLWGEAILPLLYPGALVLMFGGTRMWHRLAAGMEDAGFQLWDTLMWIHGQGFPKGQDISKLIDKASGAERVVLGKGVAGVGSNNTDSRGVYGRTFTVTEPTEASLPWAGHKTPALKPSWEPILCFRAPSQGLSYAELAQKFGSGSLNIHGGRIGTDGGTLTVVPAPKGSAATNAFGKGISGHRSEVIEDLGRYPANLALDEESAAMLDGQSGVSTSGVETSRFFYCAKPSSAERDAGLPTAQVYEANGNGFSNHISGCIHPHGNNHPTVKPIDLCKWLATLLLPPSSVGVRRLLVPFSGSGSEMIGSLGAGWDEVVGIEQEFEYCQFASARIKAHVGLMPPDDTFKIQKLNEAQPRMW